MIKTEFSVSINFDDLQKRLNRMSHSLRQSKMNKVIEKVMKQLLAEEKKSLRKTVSSKGYADLMKGKWKKESISPKGIYLKPAKSGWGYVISIAQKNADFRLKWFEHGTSERLRKDQTSTGRIEGNNWFSNTIDQEADRLCDEMASLLKKEIES